MKTMLRSALLASLAWAALFFAGCATQVPAFIHDGYRKSAEDSAVLHVGRFWVEAGANGSAVVTGTITRKTPEGDTSKSHLVVVLCDARGAELLSAKIGFEPQTMPEEWGPHATAATFRHTFPQFPAGVAEIRVKAVD